MKVIKEAAPLEQAVQKIEAAMREAGIRVDWTCNGMVINHGGNDYPIVELDSHDTVTSFPRTFDGERLKVMD